MDRCFIGNLFTADGRSTGVLDLIDEAALTAQSHIGVHAYARGLDGQVVMISAFPSSVVGLNVWIFQVSAPCRQGALPRIGPVLAKGSRVSSAAQIAYDAYFAA